MAMTVRARVLTIKLLEQQEKHPEYLKQLGVHVTIRSTETIVVKGVKKERV